MGSGEVAQPPLVPQPTQLTNLSVRSKLKVGDSLVVGFVITGGSGSTVRVMVRAIGPTLAQFGVTDYMPDPRLVLTANTSFGSISIAQNDWDAPTPLVTTDIMKQLRIESSYGAFPLPADSKDAGLLVDLKPGAYTITVSGTNAGDAGTVLAEVYNVAPNFDSGAARLSNLSVLGSTSDESPLLAGFILQGNTPEQLLLRAIGPSLALFGVKGTIADPKIDVLSGTGTRITGNDDWDVDVFGNLGNAINVRRYGLQVGAFSLQPGFKDAAIFTPLLPNVPSLPEISSYTARATGAPGTTGSVLLEIYEVPAVTTP